MVFPPGFSTMASGHDISGFRHGAASVSQPSAVSSTRTTTVISASISSGSITAHPSGLTVHGDRGRRERRDSRGARRVIGTPPHSFSGGGSDFSLVSYGSFIHDPTHVTSDHTTTLSSDVEAYLTYLLSPAGFIDNQI